MKVHASPLLRTALRIDAAGSGAMAALLLMGAGFLDGLLGIPAGFLLGVGGVLVPFVGFVAYLGRGEVAPRRAIEAVVLINALWVVDSGALLLWGGWRPTWLGIAFVVGQAAAFALIQWKGLTLSARLA